MLPAIATANERNARDHARVAAESRTRSPSSSAPCSDGARRAFPNRSGQRKQRNAPRQTSNVRAFPFIRDDSAASPTLERAQPSHDTFQRFRVFEMRAVAPVVHAPRGAAPAPRRVRSASRNSILSRAAAEPSLGSLVPDTLREMETDEEFKLAKERLETEGQAALTREERARRRRALTGMDVPSFDAFVAERGVSPLRRKPTTILQVNIGLYCNQACRTATSSPRRCVRRR